MLPNIFKCRETIERANIIEREGRGEQALNRDDECDHCFNKGDNHFCRFMI